MKYGNRKLSKSSKKYLSGVDGRIRMLVSNVLDISPYDFGIPQHGGKRTPKEQYKLFEDGVSKCDGYKNLSYHQTGFAFDVFLYEDGQASWSCTDKYAEFAELVKLSFAYLKSIGIFKDNAYIVWGGDWKSFKDLPHFEIHE